MVISWARDPYLITAATYPVIVKMSKSNTSSSKKIWTLFESALIGTIDIPIKNLVCHPSQRRLRPNHVAKMVHSMHQTGRRVGSPISVVLPVRDHGLDEDCSLWLRHAADGSLDSDIPDSLKLYVIDGWHRTCAAQVYLTTFTDPASPPSWDVLVWPAKVYKNGEWPRFTPHARLIFPQTEIFGCSVLKAWQSMQNIAVDQEPASFYEQLDGLNDIFLSGASVEVAREYMQVVFSTVDLAAALSKLPYSIIWEDLLTYIATPLGETLQASTCRAFTTWALGFDVSGPFHVLMEIIVTPSCSSSNGCWKTLCRSKVEYRKLM